MTVYTELLRSRLDGSVDPDRPVGALVAELLTSRAQLAATAVGASGSGPADQLLDRLAYDEVLVRLCDRVGVEHDLLEPFAPVGAREQAERALGRRLPLLTILEESLAI